MVELRRLTQWKIDVTMADTVERKHGGLMTADAVEHGHGGLMRVEHS